MQSPPQPETTTIHYQVSRDTLLSIWWRRMFFRPRRLIAYGAFPVAAALIYFGLPPGSGMYIIIGLITGLVLAPIHLYRLLGKAIDGNKQYTDLKTLEYSSSRLIVIGPDWRSELPWTTFHGFSEDDEYFYLHLSDNGLASVLPKQSFTADQQQQFRQYAQACNG